MELLLCPLYVTPPSQDSWPGQVRKARVHVHCLTMLLAKSQDTSQLLVARDQMRVEPPMCTSWVVCQGLKPGTLQTGFIWSSSLHGTIFCPRDKLPALCQPPFFHRKMDDIRLPSVLGTIGWGKTCEEPREIWTWNKELKVVTMAEIAINPNRCPNF